MPTYRRAYAGANLPAGLRRCQLTGGLTPVSTYRRAYAGVNLPAGLRRAARLAKGASMYTEQLTQRLGIAAPASPQTLTGTATVNSGKVDLSVFRRALFLFETGTFGGTSPTLSAVLQIQESRRRLDVERQRHHSQRHGDGRQQPGDVGNPRRPTRHGQALRSPASRLHHRRHQRRPFRSPSSASATRPPTSRAAPRTMPVWSAKPSSTNGELPNHRVTENTEKCAENEPIPRNPWLWFVLDFLGVFFSEFSVTLWLALLVGYTWPPKTSSV